MDDTVSIGTVSIQTSTDTYQYGHHAVPIQLMVTAAKNNDYSGLKTICFTTIDFETLSHIHVYRIEYVSYRQGLYRIRIDTADDRIVPALELT